jgi:hypothetical protein
MSLETLAISTAPDFILFFARRARTPLDFFSPPFSNWTPFIKKKKKKKKKKKNSTPPKATQPP